MDHYLPLQGCVLTASLTKRLPAKTLVDAHNVLAESWGFEPQIGFGPILA